MCCWSALTALNLFQTWQYQIEIISPNRMTWDYYWRVFLKTDRDYDDERLLLVKRSADSEEQIEYPDEYVSARHHRYGFEAAANNKTRQHGLRRALFRVYRQHP